MLVSEQAGGGSRNSWFTTTHWTVVLSARDSASPQASQALETLCRTYWYPLYAYIRRCGHTAHEAQDLTQEFLARLLAKDALTTVDKRKGRFRSFLLASLNHFLANERQRNGAAKRGGHLEILSLDDSEAECRYALEPASPLTPEKVYERQWAQALLVQALKRLADEFSAAGKAATFRHLKEFLQCEESDRSYAEVGAKLGLKPSAVASAVYRLRQRYRELVRQEIAHTLPDPSDLEDELHWLFAALS